MSERHFKNVAFGYHKIRNGGYQHFSSPGNDDINSHLLIKLILCLVTFSLCLTSLLYFSVLYLGLYSFQASTKGIQYQNDLEFRHDVLHFHKHSEEELNKCNITADEEKFDCYPQEGGSEAACEARGCCWTPCQGVQLGVPWCYYPLHYGGYKFVNITPSDRGIVAFLNRTFPSGYPEDVELLKMDVVYQGDTRLRISIRDALSERFEAPYPEVPQGPDIPPRSPQYKVEVQQDSLGFSVTRLDGRLVFDAMNLGGLIYSNQLLQLSGRLPPAHLYGLAEHQTDLSLNLNWTRLTLFNHDTVPQAHTNLYGSHPMYLALEEDGLAHGVFLHNSNAMDVILQPTPAITFRAIGGILDLYFLLGPSPAQVISQYVQLVGLPFMPPYWSLGFHLCRYGYKDVTHLKAVWQRTRDAGIPFDVQWNDIDYMTDNNDFTVDTQRYAELPSFLTQLHDAGMHYVPILDPGVSGAESPGSYPPYDDALSMGVLVKNAAGGVFVGKVWNRNSTVFPDFTNPKTEVYWTHLLRELHKSIPFDGLWIDMNEPSNFLDGEVSGCAANPLDSPPYLPAVEGGKLSYKTLCMDAIQSAGRHYDVHNLHGISETAITSRALKQILNKRPFIISRSTFSGHGHYGGHWTGDVASTWEDMQATVPQMLTFSILGVPMIGADICGFNGNTTAQLCSRWSQLGAFYPFSRNHNTDDAIDQDPVALGPDVVSAARKALSTRYTLLPYLYTLFWKAHVFGETVARPLFVEFPTDPATHTLSLPFLWGPSVLFCPVLTPLSTTTSCYLPAGVWFRYPSGLGTMSDGTEVSLAAGSEEVPVLVRGGAVVPTQPPANNTKLSREGSVRLIAAFNSSQAAEGTLYWDDGESLHTYEEGMYALVEFHLTASTLHSTVPHWNISAAPSLDQVVIWGFAKPVESVQLDGSKRDFVWDPTALVLTVKDLKVELKSPFALTWS